MVGWDQAPIQLRFGRACRRRDRKTDDTSIQQATGGLAPDAFVMEMVYGKRTLDCWAVGVPEMIPVPVANVRPAGSAPTTAHEIGVLSPG